MSTARDIAALIRALAEDPELAKRIADEIERADRPKPKRRAVIEVPPDATEEDVEFVRRSMRRRNISGA